MQVQGREQAHGDAAMSSITAGTYPESVSSCCHPPTPPPSPSPHPAAAPASAISGGGAPLRLRFDFPDANSGGDPEEVEDDIIRVVEYIERARQCACGRGRCAVEQDEQRGRWVYVCPAQPKCNYVSMCEEVGLDPELQPAIQSPPKPSNNCVINISSNHVAEPRTPINNVNLQGAGATTSNIVSPQATIPKAPLNSTFQSAGTSIPLQVSPKGPSTTAVVKIIPQGTRSNHKWCKCGAGKCRELRKGCKDYYVCPIPKGHGACSYMVPVVDAVSDPTQTGTRKDKHLKDNPVQREDNGNNLDQAQDNNANGSVNPSQPYEKEVHGNNVVQAQDNDVNGSVSSQSDDEWPFEVFDNDIVLTVQTTTSAKVRQASPSMKCQTTAMAEAEAPTESLMPLFDTSSPINPRPENCVSPTGRILQACGSVNPSQPDEKEVHGNNVVQAQDNNVNGSVSSQSDDEWPFEVVDNDIVLTVQTTTSAEVSQASPSMKCQTTAMAEAEAPTESTVPRYDTSSPINQRPENRVSPTERILQACGELLISCCSGLCPP